MELRSPAFERDGAFPVKYTRDGDNASPPLSWADVPEQTQELALIFENVTPHTQKPYAQWLLYGMAPQTRELPEGLLHRRQPEMAGEPVHGKNDNGNVGYDGPLGVQNKRIHFVFRLYALDKSLDVKEGLTADALREAMQDHVIEEAELGTVYERPKY
ncbi:MAG: YbhB/YbcL family Raf kinase inhibitor-like protein [Chitinivibrionales bacterium]|nr:YbhB/YbcL family Raf kinase inhibitor-like protein [Chitinivibrionales bacterium]